MLDNKVNIARAFRAYQKVVDMGIKEKDQYVFQGVSVWAESDEYTIALSEGKVTLRIFFHQRFSLEAPTRKEASLFLRKLEKIERL